MAASAKWYVVHTYSGYENAVAATVMKSAENRKMQDLIFETNIPMETVTEVTDSSSLGILFTNLTDNNLESCTIGESEYKDLHCGSIDMIPGESDVHIHLEEKDDYNAAREILNILMGGEE